MFDKPTLLCLVLAQINKIAHLSYLSECGERKERIICVLGFVNVFCSKTKLCNDVFNVVVKKANGSV